MRDAIERVCDQSDISPVSAAFRQVLSKRSGALKDTAKLFWKSLRSVAGRRDEKGVQQAVETAQQEAEETVGGVMAPLRTALEAIPPEHFTELEGALEAELAREGVLAAGR
jgi:hypothetical protein